MGKIRDLDAHGAAPSSIKDLFRFYQKIPNDQLEGDLRLLDLRKGPQGEQRKFVHVAGTISNTAICAAYSHIATGAAATVPADVQIYEVDNLPGLRLIPSLLPPKSQEELLSRLLHDNLANHKHKTNVHLHHKIPYHAAQPENRELLEPAERHKTSFFHLSPNSAEKLFQPLDDVVHKPFTVSQFLSRKLRWLTLGGQFDWTGKRYPVEDEPPFPEDIGNLTSTLFPYMRPEAGIVNIYRPGDVLSVHRDVSEECDNALVSFSIGCEAILVVGLQSAENETARNVAIRLCSGDAICLSGEARFAWHGVPQIIPGTCPEFLWDWPARSHTDGLGTDSSLPYEGWRGWMMNTRVNLSVRQIRD